MNRRQQRALTRPLHIRRTPRPPHTRPIAGEILFRLLLAVALSTVILRVALR